jgi:hypothetical protein
LKKRLVGVAGGEAPCLVIAVVQGNVSGLQGLVHKYGSEAGFITLPSRLTAITKVLNS